MGLGACSQISSTSLDQVPTVEPSAEIDSDQPGSPANEPEAGDQLQAVDGPPSTLAAIDDSQQVAESQDPADSDQSGETGPTADVEWITIELEDIFDDVHEVHAAIPTGWVPHEVFEDRWQPAEDTGYGFFTDIAFDNGCDGICQAKDWEAALNATDGRLSRLREEFPVLRDEPIENGWILVTEGVVVSHRVSVFRWNDDADFYFECRVELDDDDAELADEMLEVCLLSDPLWLD